MTTQNELAGYIVGKLAADIHPSLSSEDWRMVIAALRAAASAEPVAWRWRTLPQWSETAADQEWQLLDKKPVASDFMNFHHHEFEALYTHHAPDAEIVAALSDAILHLRFAQSGFETPEIDNDWLNKRDEIVRTGEMLLAKAKGGRS